MHENECAPEEYKRTGLIKENAIGHYHHHNPVKPLESHASFTIWFHLASTSCRTTRLAQLLYASYTNLASQKIEWFNKTEIPKNGLNLESWKDFKKVNK